MHIDIFVFGSWLQGDDKNLALITSDKYHKHFDPSTFWLNTITVQTHSHNHSQSYSHTHMYFPVNSKGQFFCGHRNGNFSCRVFGFIMILQRSSGFRHVYPLSLRFWVRLHFLFSFVDGRLGWMLNLASFWSLSGCYGDDHYKSNNTGHNEMGYKHIPLENTTLKHKYCNIISLQMAFIRSIKTTHQHSDGVTHSWLRLWNISLWVFTFLKLILFTSL